MRNLKVLGLALVAVFAMSSLIAAAASADKFTSESYPVTLTGDQDEGTDLLTLAVGTISCKQIKYDATVAGPTLETEAEAAFSECTGLGIPSKVHMNGCKYRFTQTTAGAGATTSKVDIVCPPEKEITMTAGEPTVRCTTHIPAQNGLGHVNWTKVGTPNPTREITGDISIAKITYKTTKGTGLGACPTLALREDGEYTGRVRFTGENPATGAHVGIFLS